MASALLLLHPTLWSSSPSARRGLPATHTLAKEGIRVNMTLVFSAPQALLAASAGARYISPFVGRFDDIGDDGIQQLATVVQCVKNYTYWLLGRGGRPRDASCRLCAYPNHVTQGGARWCRLIPPRAHLRSRSAYLTAPTKVARALGLVG